MITLLLFGGAILLVAMIQLARRMQRTKTNAYDRFLHDKSIDSGRVEDMRTYKLRMAGGLKGETASPTVHGEEPPVQSS